MVKARAKQSVSEQMKKRIEDLVIFFELLWDKIKTPKGAIASAVIACLLVAGSVFAIKIHSDNKYVEPEIKKVSGSEEDSGFEKGDSEKTLDNSDSAAGSAEKKETSTSNGSNRRPSRWSSEEYDGYSSSSSGSYAYAVPDYSGDVTSNNSSNNPSQNSSDTSGDNQAQQGSQGTDETGNTSESGGSDVPGGSSGDSGGTSGDSGGSGDSGNLDNSGNSGAVDAGSGNSAPVGDGGAGGDTGSEV